MQHNYSITLCLIAFILLLPSCGFDVNLAPQPLNIAICRPIEITMSKQTQDEIAQAVAQAISSQIPEIKKQLFATPASSSFGSPRATQASSSPQKPESSNIIIVDVGDKSSNIPHSFHVPPNQFGDFDGQAQLLDKKTPILIYTPVHNPQIIKTVTDKLKNLGFTRVGTYSGDREALPSLT